MRHITRHKCTACASLSTPATVGGQRFWHMTAGFFGAAQDGIKRRDDGKGLHSTAESGACGKKTAPDAVQVHCLRRYITSAAGLLWLALRLRRLPRFPLRLDSGSFFGAAPDGMKRHDDGKPLHSPAKNGTYRQNAAHNAAQVHSLRQFVTPAARQGERASLSPQFITPANGGWRHIHTIAAAAKASSRLSTHRTIVLEPTLQNQPFSCTFG